MSDDQRDYAEEAANRADMERDGRLELAGERVARGIAWLVGQGFALTDLGPSQYVYVISQTDCPLGRTIGYRNARQLAVPRPFPFTWEQECTWTEQANDWCRAHGFLAGDGWVTWDDLDTVWRIAIDQAHAEADALNTAE